MWTGFTSALGVSGPLSPGDRVVLSVEGLPRAEGVVERADHPSIPSVCTADALYMFMHGYRGTVVVEQHSFAGGVDGPAVERAWATWLARTFA